MRYLLLIYNQSGRPEPSQAEFDALLQGHVELYRELAGTGEVISSAALPEAPAAATVRIDDGVPAVTDGPFLEAKEFLAGYYLVECDTLERAVEIAGRIPCGAHGAVEVRPIDEATTRLVRGENDQ